jgi:hypothetical protein
MPSTVAASRVRTVSVQVSRQARIGSRGPLRHAALP